MNAIKDTLFNFSMFISISLCIAASQLTLQCGVFEVNQNNQTRILSYIDHRSVHLAF